MLYGWNLNQTGSRLTFMVLLTPLCIRGKQHFLLGTLNGQCLIAGGRSFAVHSLPDEIWSLSCQGRTLQIAIKEGIINRSILETDCSELLEIVNTKMAPPWHVLSTTVFNAVRVQHVFSEKLRMAITPKPLNPLTCGILFSLLICLVLSGYDADGELCTHFANA